MKKLLFYSFGTVLLLSLSCKKDYPKDIPKWLKERIKEIKVKECPRPEPYEYTHYQIQEMSNDTTNIFLFTAYRKYSHERDTYYDYEGNFIGETYANPDAVPSIPPKNLFPWHHTVRIIWKPNSYEYCNR